MRSAVTGRVGHRELRCDARPAIWTLSVNAASKTRLGALACRRDATAAWAAGFISGYNYFNESTQVVRELSRETILAYIDKHCRDNPLNNITHAVMHLICETHDGAPKPFPICDARK